MKKWGKADVHVYETTSTPALRKIRILNQFSKTVVARHKSQITGPEEAEQQARPKGL